MTFDFSPISEYTRFINFNFIDYSDGNLINLFFLLFPWLFFCGFSILKKNTAFFYLGIGLFILLIKEWLFSLYPLDAITIKQVLFWEIFFLFCFSWMVCRIYQDLEDRGWDYTFANLSSRRGRNKFSLFSPLGSALFLLLLFLGVSQIESIRGETGIALLFYIIMMLNLERKFYYWKLDYDYFGTPWTHPLSITIIRFFYTFFGIGFASLFVVAILDANDYHFFQKDIYGFLPIFALIKTAALFNLCVFLYHVFILHNRKMAQFRKQKVQHRDWANLVFAEGKKITHPEQLPSLYPDMEFLPTDHRSSLEPRQLQQLRKTWQMLGYLAGLLEKTESAWVYFHRPQDGIAEKRLVVSRSRKPWKGNLSHLSHDFIEFPPSLMIEALTPCLESGQPRFFYNLSSRSVAFKKQFAQQFTTLPAPPAIESFIVYPFLCQGERCSLLLLNPKFKDEPQHPERENLLRYFVEAFALVDLPEKSIENIQEHPTALPQIETSSIDTGTADPDIKVTEVLPEKSDAPSEPKPSPSEGVAVPPEKPTPSEPKPSPPEEVAVPPEKPTPSEPKPSPSVKPSPPTSSKSSQTSKTSRSRGRVFPPTREKNRFIIKTNLEQTYLKNTERVNRAFHPAGNRSRDKITYKIDPLFKDKDKFQYSLFMATNTGRKGKLFVFNELYQDHSLSSATLMALQNLFYSFLPKKKVEVFADEWHKGFKPFGEKDRCHFIAFSFHPDNHLLSFYNAGIKHAYYFNINRNSFSPLPMHLSHLLPHAEWMKHLENNSTNKSQMTLQPNDLVVILSQGILDIKNRDGEAISIEAILKNIRRNKGLAPDEISHEVVRFINDFGYSLGDNQQAIFISKILP